VSHTLHLTYSRPVWEHHVEVRLTPQHSSHQHVLASELTIDPSCEARSYLDAFGNQVHYFSLIKPHDHLTVQMNAQVDTLLSNPFDYTAVTPSREREWLTHRCARSRASGTSSCTVAPRRRISPASRCPT
jgi:transglutaminase-like putative cysteine protease